MNVNLENDQLSVTIAQKGAELKSVVSKHTSLEYMWSGDPAFWGKTSPILFPIVGTLKNDTYFFNGKSHRMTRHGFARDHSFEISQSEEGRAVFSLASTDSSYEMYPFHFLLEVEYKLIYDAIEVSYVVQNNGKDPMYFSIGGHPAFKVPLVPGRQYEDYHLQFNRNEDLMRWPIDAKGLIKETPVPLKQNTSILKLSRSLFDTDALVFKDLRSHSVSIKSERDVHGIDFDFYGFPYLGIWAAKNGDFVCIEPWCGIADAVVHDQQLEHKEGIVKLSAGEKWMRTWKVKFY